MAAEAKWPTRTIAVKNGWFSRRHETDAEHRAHRAVYRTERGKAGRQKRAELREAIASASKLELAHVAA